MSSVNKSILLVDDDQEIRELLDTYLSRAGFQVRTTPDGAGFRQALNEAPSDLVILDVMLPDEDGFSLCRWIRQHPRQFRRGRPGHWPGTRRRRLPWQTLQPP